MAKKLYRVNILAWVIYGVLVALLLLAPLPLYLQNSSPSTPTTQGAKR